MPCRAMSCKSVECLDNSGHGILLHDAYHSRLWSNAMPCHANTRQRHATMPAYAWQYMSPNHAIPCCRQGQPMPHPIFLRHRPCSAFPPAFARPKVQQNLDKMISKGERKLFRSAVAKIAVNLPSALINRYKKTKNRLRKKIRLQPCEQVHFMNTIRQCLKRFLYCFNCTWKLTLY